MPTRTGWTRQQLLVAFNLYCRVPFGKMHSHNPEIIRYAELIRRTPSALAMKLTNIASLDPEITSTGRKGLEGASAADRAMWGEMQADWEAFILEMEGALASLGSDAEADVAAEGDSGPEESVDYTGTNKSVLTTSRVGQDFFRRAVLSAYNNRCCISGLAISKLLVASHIVPWRTDPKNRLNPRNGLCLSVLHDKAFDLGIITISEDMTVRVSRSAEADADQFFRSALLSFDKKPVALPEKFRPQKEFLSYHRSQFY